MGAAGGHEAGDDAAVRVEGIDHVVLTVADVAATARFYAAVLGMEVVTFGEDRTALRFGRQKINLHQAGREFEPKARFPTAGAADLCFVTSTPVAHALARLRALGVDVVAGPDRRDGALGPVTSIYLRDPDGNLVELASYGTPPTPPADPPPGIRRPPVVPTRRYPPVFSAASASPVM